MQAVYSVETIRQIEKKASEHGITENMLMQASGQAIFETIEQCWPNAQSIVVFCGNGNKGGDGYVAAYLARNKLKVKIRHPGKLDQLKNHAYQAMHNCQQAGIEIKPFHAQEKFDADVFIDALLGIGLHEEVRTPIKEVIDYINQQQTHVLAIDVPSGVDADTGHILGTAVHADYTVTLIAGKPGLFTGEAMDYTGQVIQHRLNIPQQLFENSPPKATLISASHFLSFLKPRPKTAHKKNFGHVLIIGGDYGMNGAPRLTALGAARIGAGLVTIATRPEHAPTMNCIQPELMCYGIKRACDLEPLIKKATVIAIGPGLGQSKWAKTLYKQVISCQLPLIIDADALNLLAQHTAHKKNWILTPHSGEAAKLLHILPQAIEEDRLNAIMQLQQRYGGVCILKGAGTIILDTMGTPAICPMANPGLASAGTGDLLTGIIAGLIAQGLSLSTAAKLGVCLHAEAGRVISSKGERGILTTDLLPILQKMINSC